MNDNEVIEKVNLIYNKNLNQLREEVLTEQGCYINFQSCSQYVHILAVVKFTPDSIFKDGYLSIEYCGGDFLEVNTLEDKFFILEHWNFIYETMKQNHTDRMNEYKKFLEGYGDE